MPHIFGGCYTEGAGRLYKPPWWEIEASNKKPLWEDEDDGFLTDDDGFLKESVLRQWEKEEEEKEEKEAKD